jgi:pilus assembly protein CpaF
MTMLMGRIGETIDLASLRGSADVPDALALQIERVAREQVKAMRDEGEAPDDLDLDALAREAHRELVGLGVLALPLEDDEVSEIHVVRYDQIFVVRAGVSNLLSSGFSSEDSLRLVIERLLHQGGEPWGPGQSVIERRLPRASVVALAPPSSSTLVLSIKKQRRIEATLDDLVRGGSLSRPMAQFLETCVLARVNVLVTGQNSSVLMAALAAAGAALGERVCVVQDVEEVAVAGRSPVVSVSVASAQDAGADTLRAVANLKCERLIVAQLSGALASATLDAVASGSDGVVAAIAAPSLRQGLARFALQLLAQRSGLALDAARETIGEVFDLAIETVSASDGRIRITRIAELGGTDAKGIVARDLFAFASDAAQGEGAFSATGVVPRFAAELANRGFKFDPAVFKRAGR